MDFNYSIIKRPVQERFDMHFEESYAFWMIVVHDYSVAEIRSGSLQLLRGKNDEYTN